MSNEDKKNLLDMLAETRSVIHAALEGIDPEMPVYTDTDWRVRDIIGHIATWDRQVAKSIRAFLAGTEYSIPNLEEDIFNQTAVLEQRALTSQQTYEEWKQARQDFIDAVGSIPTDLFPGDLLYPWGDERGSVSTLVKYMVEHDLDHKDEILKAKKVQEEQ
jgi:hypothetical protein